jgi:hypothetical protein
VLHRRQNDGDEKEFSKSSSVISSKRDRLLKRQVTNLLTRHFPAAQKNTKPAAATTKAKGRLLLRAFHGISAKNPAIDLVFEPRDHWTAMTKPGF